MVGYHDAIRNIQEQERKEREKKEQERCNHDWERWEEEVPIYGHAEGSNEIMGYRTVYHKYCKKCSAT